MTIMLNSEQEQARAAIRDGKPNSIEEFIDRAIAELGRKPCSAEPAPTDRAVFRQGFGLFGSPEDAALLDEIVTLAYEERRRPDRPEPTL